MNRILIASICVFFLACGPKKELYEIIASGDDKILIIDEKTSDEVDVNVVWSWQASEVAAQLPEIYRDHLRTIADCKSVDNDTKLLVVFSSGCVVLLDRTTKKCLFYTRAANAHSADFLPNNRIAVALSVKPEGNAVEIYDVAKPEQVLYRDSLYSGHGAVWMPERNRFYALGYDQLREYSLADWESASPKLHLEKTRIIPVESGHDLSPVSDNKLLISGHEGVCMFDIMQDKFIPFKPLQSTKDVKSVYYDENTQKTIYTKAEEEWWTHHIYLKNPDKKLIVPNIDLYKVRVIKK